MKKVFFTLALATFALLSFTTINKSNQSAISNPSIDVASVGGNIDIETSVILWKGFKPTGSHEGTILLKPSSMQVKRGELKGGKFVIDMSTIKESKDSKRLERHLSSEDFFDIKIYPTATFVITKVEKQEGKLAITGNLTIKDVTKSVTFPASFKKVEGKFVFKSETFKINRADYNIKYKSKSFFSNLKDKFINDMMELSFEVNTI